MKKCIICNESKNKKDFSSEHIIPKAIGGFIIINDVCKKCNSFLGTKVDSILVDNIFTNFAKYNYKLKSGKGKIKHPFGLTKIKNTNKSILWGHDETKDESYLKFYPKVNIDGKKVI